MFICNMIELVTERQWEVEQVFPARQLGGFCHSSSQRDLRSGPAGGPRVLPCLERGCGMRPHQRRPWPRVHVLTKGAPLPRKSCRAGYLLASLARRWAPCPRGHPGDGGLRGGLGRRTCLSGRLPLRLSRGWCTARRAERGDGGWSENLPLTSKVAGNVPPAKSLVELHPGGGPTNVQVQGWSSGQTSLQAFQSTTLLLKR